MKKFFFTLACIVTTQQALFSQLFIEEFYVEIVSKSLIDYFKKEGSSTITEGLLLYLRDIVNTYLHELKKAGGDFVNIEKTVLHTLQNATPFTSYLDIERKYSLYTFFKENMRNWINVSEVAFQNAFVYKVDNIKNAKPINKITVEWELTSNSSDIVLSRYKTEEVIMFAETLRNLCIRSSGKYGISLASAIEKSLEEME